MRVIRSKLDYVDTEYRVLAKLNGKTVGFIDKNLNGTYSYAFGRPKASYVSFNVDDLDTAKSRLEEHVFMGNSRRPIKSENKYGADIDRIYEKQLNRIKKLKTKGYSDDEIDDDEIVRQTKEDMRNVGKIKSSRRPVKSGYEGDDAEAEELALYIKNTSELYHGITKSIIENLKKKARKGAYDKERAVDAWMYAADAGAKMYDKEFGSGRGSLTMFSKSSRRKAAEELARYYEENVLEGLDNVQSAFRPIKSAVDGGWEVDSSEVDDAYNFAIEYFGEDELNRQIIQALGADELAACLAFIFRMNDFREWDEYKNSDEEIESSHKISSGKHTVEYSKPSREELEKVLDDFLAQKKVKFATDIYDDTVDYILTFWDEQDFKPRSVEEAVTDWYNDTKKHFPEDLKKISAAYHRWIKSKLIRSSRRMRIR